MWLYLGLKYLMLVERQKGHIYLTKRYLLLIDIWFIDGLLKQETKQVVWYTLLSIMLSVFLKIYLGNSFLCLCLCSLFPSKDGGLEGRSTPEFAQTTPLFLFFSLAHMTHSTSV